jgi:cyclopropane fatty-acyl-phospholipid synthase-like methyltransferase
MESLFKPVPFGEVRVSPMEEVLSAAYAQIWDLFRSIDMDKEQRVLEVGCKWI